jgi:hypothetical protein
VLLVNKYIKKNKPIIIKAGFTATVDFESLKNGLQIFAPKGSGPRIFGVERDASDIFRIKVVGNNLFINSHVRSIDQKIIAIIRNNSLEVNKGLRQRSSENFIEILDDYGIPVLQIILNKDNSIEINGVFFSQSSCVIANKNSIYSTSFTPFDLMNEEERKQTTYKIRQEAKKIRPLD